MSSNTLDFGFGLFGKFGKTFKKDEIIFCEYEPGNSFFFLIEGKVKVAKISADSEKTLDILLPGEIFGEMAILEDAPRSATMIAIDDVKVLEFNKANFNGLMRSKPELTIKLLRTFAKRIYDQKRRLMILTLDDPDIKIMDVFIMLAENKGVDIYNSTEIKFDITAEDVANWCGMDKSKCSQILFHFQKQNRIVIAKNTITVNNINDFYRMVNTKRRAIKK